METNNLKRKKKVSNLTYFQISLNTIIYYTNKNYIKINYVTYDVEF